MNRKSWTSLYRSIRRKDVNVAYTIKHHGIIAQGRCGAVRVDRWSMAHSLLAYLMDKRFEMSTDQRWLMLAAIREA